MGCQWWGGTYSSVTSLGMPLGRVRSPLLLHRTTVSTQVHCSGQRGPSWQLLSSLPVESRGVSMAQVSEAHSPTQLPAGKGSPPLRARTGNEELAGLIRGWKGKKMHLGWGTGLPIFYHI